MTKIPVGLAAGVRIRDSAVADTPESMPAIWICDHCRARVTRVDINPPGMKPHRVVVTFRKPE